MQKLISLALMAGLTSTTLLGIAQQTTPRLQNVPMQQTPIGSGQQMYVKYCAVCHGTEGVGNGPAAQALKARPADLATLSQTNGGVFPSNHVISVLQFGVKNPAHGSSEMPVWGDLMMTLNPTSQNDSAQVNQRIMNLTNYLKTMQK
jgi:mono/diheme cytochrome c family protein